MSCGKCRKKIKDESLTKCSTCKNPIEKVPDFSVEISIDIDGESKTFMGFKSCFKFEIPDVEVEKREKMLDIEFGEKACIVEYYAQEKKKDGAEDTSSNYPILQSFKIKTE